MNKPLLWVIGATLGCSLISCGGSSSESSNIAPPASISIPVASVGNPFAPVAFNELRLTVDAGPAELSGTNVAAVNALYASVTICPPGGTTCQTVDDVLVDTGSTGLRLLASEVDRLALPEITEPNSGEPLRRCQRFLDGTATWGSVVLADVELGSSKVTSLPVHLIANAAAGAAPASCTTGSAAADVIDLRARGILGVSSLIQDCGLSCAVAARSGNYYICPLRGGTRVCEAAAAPLARQVRNPIASMSSDNNGLVIKLPALPAAGARSVTGSLFFGVDTQANNALGSAQLFTLDFDNTFFITYQGVTDIGFIDSGSNGLFFNSDIPLCTDNVFYCPSGNRMENMEILGLNNRSARISIEIANAETILGAGAIAMSNLAATFDGEQQGPVDLGLPFFFGKSVYVLLEQRSAGGTTGPAVGF